MKLRQLIESFVISNDEFEDYLDRATEQLAGEIQSGKNVRDAVHDLAVQFSKQHNNAYAAYVRMQDGLFARMHTLELDGSESTDIVPAGEPEVINDPMGAGMDMDVPPSEEMPMDQEMDDYAAVMDNKPEEEMEESVNEASCGCCGNDPCDCGDDCDCKKVDEATVQYTDADDTVTKVEVTDNELLINGNPAQRYDWNSSAKAVINPNMHSRAKGWKEIHAYLKRAAEMGRLDLAAKQVFIANEEDFKVIESCSYKSDAQRKAVHANKNKMGEGWETLPPMDTEKYQARSGLEGPFQTRVGKVVYYDPKQGQYYDPDKDMYMTYDEFKALDGDSPLRNEAEEKFAGWLAHYGGKKMEIRKGEAKDLYSAKLKAIKALKVPKSKQGLLSVKPAYESMNESKQLNEFVPLAAPIVTALAPHIAGAAARAVGGALARRGATALAKKGAQALAKRGMNKTASAITRATQAAKTANTTSKIGKAVDTAKTVANVMKGAGTGSTGAGAAGKDYSTLSKSIKKLK